jgi:hypothetical protein
MDWGARLGVKMNRIKEENSMECERTHRTSQVSKTESRNTTLDSLVQKSRKMHRKKSKAKKREINPKNPEPPRGISSEVFNPKHPALPTGIVQSRCRSVPKHPTKESKNPK